MPPLQLRQEFPTLKAFKEALHTWAIEAHFEPRILKSDTGRVRVGCKRDPNCPFVIRCNWERKGGRDPLARVTVLRDRHTCLNGVEWTTIPAMGMVGDGMGGVGGAGLVGAGGLVDDGMGNGRVMDGSGQGGVVAVPVLPKVQRNSASRLPFLMEILPRLMTITKETTPVEIRDVLMREYSAEVHLQQCRRAKTEILKKQSGEGQDVQDPNHPSSAGEHSVTPGGRSMAPQQGGPPQMSQQQQSQRQHPSQQNQHAQRGMLQQQQQAQLDGLGHDSGNESAGASMFAELTSNPNASPHPTFVMHTGPGGGVVVPRSPSNRSAGPPLGSAQMGGPMGAPPMMAPSPVGSHGVNTGPHGMEQPVRCPYCINARWLRSIKDAVDHMSMHVVTD